MHTLFDICQQLDAAIFREIVQEANGGAYVICPTYVSRNTDVLLSSLRARYRRSDVAISYKTNYNKAFLQSAVRSGAIHEVVSLQEYKYARMLGAGDEQIIFNGPGKTREILLEVLSRPITLIVDSVAELERIAALKALGTQIKARLGIRVNPKLDFQSTVSRFGIDLDDTGELQSLRDLIARSEVTISGIHMHITDDRSAESYLQRLDALYASWQALDVGELQFIDCGGGFASAMPDVVRQKLGYHVDDLASYGEVIGAWLTKQFPAGDVQFICEPGTGLMADAGVYLTEVLDVKKLGDRSIAVVDGTFFGINPLRSSVAPAIHHIATGDGEAHRVCSAPVAVYGNSCMDIDLLIEKYPGSLSVGDLLIFAQKGAYASCMATPFIQGIAALVEIEETGQFEIVRPRTGAEFLVSLN